MKNILLFLILFYATFSAQQNLKITGKIINSEDSENAGSLYSLYISREGKLDDAVMLDAINRINVKIME